MAITRTDREPWTADSLSTAMVRRLAVVPEADAERGAYLARAETTSLASVTN